MESIIETKNLSKHYKNKKAVDNVNIHVRKGDIYGFLGQNGAGKTTTIKMIMGLIKPTQGEVSLFGEQIRPGQFSHYGRIGSVVEAAGFYPNLTAVENLDIHRRLMGVTNRNYLEEALELTGLTEARNKKIKSFSLGMKQRLGISRALLHKPELLILDEPTNGLDPVGIKEVRKLVLDLSEQRKITVFVSSHILSEIQQIASVIGIIHNGALIEEIDYEMLKRKNRTYIELRVNDDKKAAFLLEKSLGITDYSVIDQGIIRIYEKLNESAAINKLLSENALEIAGITVLNDSLEDYFLALTGSTLNVS